MSLITRCPACGTMFKVVPDQLKISEGWVRCGHCSEVFDASAHLNPESAVEPVAQQGPGQPVGSPSSTLAPTPTPAPAPTAAPPQPAELARPRESMPPAEPPAPAGPVGRDAEPMRPQPPHVRLDDDVEPYLDAQTLAAAAQANHTAEPEPLMDDWVGEPDPPPPDVSFVRDAQRKAFWGRPAVRGATGLLALVLLAGLVGQIALQERDRLAAAVPTLKPLLQAMCEPLACAVQAPRQIDALVIDSSSFSKLRGDGYRLMFTLKNTAGFEVAMPAMELTLTDIQDQPVIRRILQPNEFGGAKASLGALGEWQAQLTLSASGGSQRIAGYRLLAFYP